MLQYLQWPIVYEPLFVKLKKNDLYVEIKKEC